MRIGEKTEHEQAISISNDHQSSIQISMSYSLNFAVMILTQEDIFVVW